MKPFGYARDPLCVIACGLYVLNRLWLRPHLGGPFLSGYFNDLLLIPAALPFLLWLQRKLGVRPDDAPPRWREIALHLAVWSLIAEVALPLLSRHATADLLDLAAYTAGAVIAGLWWHVHPVA